MRRLPLRFPDCSTWFQSTHSLRSATFREAAACADSLVSIHALLAECDFFNSISVLYFQCFNPRTPCGVRPIHEDGELTGFMFQSTHSLRSATRPALSFEAWAKQFQSTHSLRSATSRLLFIRLYKKCFNPRTPCGVRPNLTSYTPAMRGFQSTHSLRSATWSTLKSGASFPVSIHALLAECDGCPGPRISWLYRFQSTHSLRSATQDQQGLAGLAGCFNPRTPCGVRLRLTIYIVIQQRKRYFAPTSRRRPSSPSLLF